ncbi:Uncharacterized membrane protein YkoI [Micromonospora pattaloongensis]|uniref:Uncharacterized membrane protein YkoI n=1 Tax=Micromonospora pattaloongensis TaxID=405436 RepID=A0A1H3Q5T6_9ACTN|nr:PepSY domain-containing protein [Micromonospora pattaloongensis]SDZ08478.1 Uncharacterized membrane protein YkoI [Micromonospora pattaloongensis]
MKRRTLVVLVMGGVAALAATGTALGATASEVLPSASSAATAPAADDGATSAAAPDGVDRRRAAEIALARVGGGDVVKVEREVEHGRPAWHVRVMSGGARHDVYVDVATGDIVKASGRDGRSGGDDRGRDDKGGQRPAGTSDDRGYDDKGGQRPAGTSDDRGYDDKGGHRGGDDD